MNTYTPHAGSNVDLAAKAIASAPEGYLTPAPLADAIGCTRDEVSGMLQVGVQKGFLVKTREDGVTRYSLAQCDVRVEPSDEDLNALDRVLHPHRPTVVPMRPKAKAIPASDAQVAPQERPSRHFRCGLWNDGATTIEKGATRITLSKDETRELAMLYAVREPA